MMLLCIAQIDPTPFTAFGVLGALLFVIVIMGGLIYHLVTKQAAAFQSREEQFMNFIGSHTDKTNSAAKENVDKTNAALREISNNMQQSLSKIEGVISKHTNKLDAFLLTSEVLRRIEQAKKKGDILDETTIEKVVRTVVQEQKGRD